MTIEQIVDCSADELEKMSNDELLKHFQQYLIVTRPDQAPKPSSHSVMKKPAFTPQQLKAQEVAKKLGIELPLFPDSLTKKRK